MNINRIINHGEQLSKEDKAYIKNYKFEIYWNDSTSKHWTFDIVLPSGRFLEDIAFNTDLTVKEAYVY